VNSRPVSRIRVFAGPNGSGKSTLLNRLADSEIPLYCVINPDEIESKLGSKNGLLLSDFGLAATRSQFLTYVADTTYAAEAKRAAERIRFQEDALFSPLSRETSYNAALVAAFLRTRLIGLCRSFSFESVFSHASKLDELRMAKKKGRLTG